MDLGVLPSTEIVWGLVSRGLGALFLFAHASLLPQLATVCGSRGVAPFAPKLAMLRKHFGLRRLLEVPSLLWLSSSDAAMTSLALLGCAGGAWAVVGGPYAGAGLFVAWLAYLSLADAAGLVFPWDAMLLEAGSLALFLPATSLATTSWAATAAPSPAVAFMLQWLAVRLMWGFAKVKFIGTKKGDDLYLKTFLIWLPMPSPLGWRLHHLPDWFHRASLRFMWLAEVVAPALVLFPGVPRLIGAALLVLLMVGIHVTGNWGFFNVGYVVLCVAFLDVHAGVANVIANRAALFATPADAALTSWMALLFLVSVIQLLAFNTWVSRSWLHWPLFDVLRRRSAIVLVVVDALRVIVALRLANAYGVFPPNSGPALRITPVFETSDDGLTWARVRYRHLPAVETDPPPWVAPHHPRLDQFMIYVVGGFSDAGLLTTLVGYAGPQSAYLRHSGLERATQLLLGDDELLRSQLRSETGAKLARPKRARVSAWASVPTSVDERKRTGRSWRMRRVGTIVQPTGPDEGVFRRYMGEPECIHPDLVEWKRRARPLLALTEALSTLHVHDAVLAGSDLTAAQRERFWHELVPAARAHLDRDGGAGSGVSGAGSLSWASVDTARAGFSFDDMIVFERLLERYAWALRTVLEPHKDGAMDPHIRRTSAFRFALALWLLVVDGGREGVERAMQDRAGEATAVDAIARQTKERQLALFMLMRPLAIELASQSWRWSMAGELVAGQKLPGVYEYAELIRAVIPRDEEWRPEVHRDADGHWAVAL